MVDFNALAARADAIVAKTFSETLRHSPMKNGTADPSRPQRDVKGLLYAPSARGMINVAGTSIVIAAGEHALLIERAAHPTLVMTAKDRLRATTRPGSPLFEVKAVNDRMPGVLLVTLGEA